MSTKLTTTSGKAKPGSASRNGTDSVNPKPTYSGNAEVASKPGHGRKPSRGSTDHANPRDGITGIADGRYKPTKTNY